MLGRVMMPIGTASCTACNTRFIISPSPSGLPFGLPFPFGINGCRLSIARATTKCSRPNGSPKGQRSNLVLCIRLAPLVGREHFVVSPTG